MLCECPWRGDIEGGVRLAARAAAEEEKGPPHARERLSTEARVAGDEDVTEADGRSQKILLRASALRLRQGGKFGEQVERNEGPQLLTAELTSGASQPAGDGPGGDSRTRSGNRTRAGAESMQTLIRGVVDKTHDRLEGHVLLCTINDRLRGRGIHAVGVAKTQAVGNAVHPRCAWGRLRYAVTVIGVLVDADDARARDGAGQEGRCHHTGRGQGRFDHDPGANLVLQVADRARRGE